jgi:hypothetical protein
MEKLGDSKLSQTLIIGMFLFTYDRILHKVIPSSVYRLFPRFQGYDAFRTAVTLRNGQATIRKRL